MLIRFFFLVKYNVLCFCCFVCYIDKVAEEEIELHDKIKKKEETDEKPIRGVAMLHGKLFIVRRNSSNLEVYDCDNFILGRELLNVPEVADARDICSCKINDFLYIMDKK